MKRVGNIWIAAFSHLPLMSFFGKIISQIQDTGINVGVVIIKFFDDAIDGHFCFTNLDFCVKINLCIKSFCTTKL